MKTCEICGKNFASRQGYHRHKKVHTVQTFPCVQCGKTFTRKDVLKKHEKTHTNQQPASRPDRCQSECLDAIDGHARQVSYLPETRHARDPLVFQTDHQTAFVELLQSELHSRKGLKFYPCLKVNCCFTSTAVILKISFLPLLYSAPGFPILTQVRYRKFKVGAEGHVVTTEAVQPLLR